MSAPELEPYSREWFVSRIGEELVAHGERLARDAPPASAAQKELVRRIFADEPIPIRPPKRHTLAA